MKITPLDIRKMVFKVRLRGYDRQDVDQFLEELAQTVETLNRDHTVLREKLASAEQHLAELRKAETTLRNTLVTTQAIADSLRRQTCPCLGERARGRALRLVPQRTVSSTPRSLAAPRARLATRLRNFATNRHE